MYLNIIPKSGQISDNHFWNEEINNLKPFATGRYPIELRAKNIKYAFIWQAENTIILTNEGWSGLKIFKITLHSVLAAFKDKYHSFKEAKEDSDARNEWLTLWEYSFLFFYSQHAHISCYCADTDVHE